MARWPVSITRGARPSPTLSAPRISTGQRWSRSTARWRRSARFWWVRRAASSALATARCTASWKVPSVCSVPWRTPSRWVTWSSATWLCFSVIRVTRASTGSMRSFSSLASFFSTNPRSRSSMGVLRPMISVFIVVLLSSPQVPLEDLLPVGRRGDAQLVPVLGHGAAGDLDPLAVQDPHQLAVRQGPLGVLRLDELLDLAFDGQRRDVIAVLPVDATVEEELHREEAALGVDVLVGDHPADRRLVHADVLGHVAQHHRPQVLDAAVEELALLADDRRRHLVDRALALVEALDQPDRRTDLVLDELLRLGLPTLAAHGLQHAAVGAADPQPGEAVVVELDDVLVAHPADEDVGLDVVRTVGAEPAAGMGLERAHQLDLLLQLRELDPELLGHGRELPAQEEVPGLEDHAPGERVGRYSLEVHLQQQALLEVAAGDAGRVEAADDGERLLHLLQGVVA